MLTFSSASCRTSATTDRSQRRRSGRRPPPPHRPPPQRCPSAPPGDRDAEGRAEAGGRPPIPENRGMQHAINTQLVIWKIFINSVSDLHRHWRLSPLPLGRSWGGQEASPSFPVVPSSKHPPHLIVVLLLLLHRNLDLGFLNGLHRLLSSFSPFLLEITSPLRRPPDGPRVLGQESPHAFLQRKMNLPKVRFTSPYDVDMNFLTKNVHPRLLLFLLPDPPATLLALLATGRGPICHPASVPENSSSSSSPSGSPSKLLNSLVEEEDEDGGSGGSRGSGDCLAEAQLFSFAELPVSRK